MKPEMLLGSVTELNAAHASQHVVVGSHGGAGTALLALRCGVGSLIFHDAGIGKEAAGIQALSILDEAGIPAASVDYASACIGDPEDMLERGVISRVNKSALGFGCREGESASVVHTLLQLCLGGVGVGSAIVDDMPSTFLRHELSIGYASTVSVVALDSASMVANQDDGAIVITGSHGGLPGRSSERALKVRPLLAAFNDAGVGIDDAGIGRLPVLEAEGIAAVCVSAQSARIGEGLSTYETGIISYANNCAAQLGARIGMPVKELVRKLSSEPINGTIKHDLTASKTI